MDPVEVLSCVSTEMEKECPVIDNVEFDMLVLVPLKWLEDVVDVFIDVNVDICFVVRSKEPLSVIPFSGVVSGCIVVWSMDTSLVVFNGVVVTDVNITVVLDACKVPLDLGEETANDSFVFCVEFRMWLADIVSFRDVCCIVIMSTVVIGIVGDCGVNVRALSIVDPSVGLDLETLRLVFIEFEAVKVSLDSILVLVVLRLDVEDLPHSDVL